LVQAAGFIAGNRQVVAFRYELVSQLNGRDALRAVAGAGEGDQQQRMCRVKVSIGFVTRSVVGTALKFFPVWRDSQGAMISPIKAEVPAPVRTIRRSFCAAGGEAVDRRTNIVDIVERGQQAGC
jgi:hypothetical protein